MKKFICLQILIVVLLAVTLVGSTFAWSNRPDVKGGYLQTPFQLTYSSSINGNACTGVTYIGQADTNGDITYDETAVSFPYAATVQSGDKLYFRTAITNGADVATNVSLIANIPTVAALDGKYFVGVSAPMNSSIAYPGETFIPVVSQYEITGSALPEDTYIDWYIEFEAAGEFTLTNVYLANN